jgi:Ser/Thr protein kinase RdoA (MazF antagonist)
MSSPHPPADAASTDTPYADLTPAAVLDALDAVGLRGDGRLLQLNSYENRVFQVHLEDGAVIVAKFYRAGRWSDAAILEEHAFARQLAEAEVPMVAPLELHAADLGVGPTGLPAPELLGPPTLARLGAWRLAAAPRRGGRAPNLEDPAVLAWLGRLLGRLHNVGATQPFAHRLRLDVATLGRGARDWLIEHDVIPPDQLPVWRGAADQALDLAQAAFDALPDLRWLRVHGDCHVGNLLWTPEGPHFVDLDDTGSAPAVQDLWMMLGADPVERRCQLDALLGGYEQVREFDDRELRLIEPLRTLRLLHHSAWIARRWRDPAFPVAFPWFESPAYWAGQAQLLRQQIELMAPGGADD